MSSAPRNKHGESTMFRRSIRSLTAAAVVVMGQAALAALAPSVVRAQDLPGRVRIQQPADPDYWVGLAYGFMNGLTLTDGASGNTWQFGYAPQLRATVEKTIQRGITAGASASF